jgi:hypothetical protein
MRWISVKDKLPEHKQHVVTLDITATYPFVSFQVYNNQLDFSFLENHNGYGHIQWAYWAPIEEFNLPSI